jgi:tyrosyl-tRNA synthetase
MPLLLTKSGAKFGKSEGNALFLNAEKTSINEIYQYFYNTADEDL